MFLGVVCWFYLTDRPQDAHWLSETQRRWLVDTLAAEHRATEAQHRYPCAAP